MPCAGIVVANDADAQRCNLLAHQTKRMCSPALIVTNHDATMYPIVTDYSAKVGVATKCNLSQPCPDTYVAARTHQQSNTLVQNFCLQCYTGSLHTAISALYMTCASTLP